MVLPEEGSLLRIFIGESDHQDGRPLYEWLVHQARELEVAGATVLRGVMGYGLSSRIHTAKILRLSQDLPIIVELVDSREKLEAYLEAVGPSIEEGLATIEKAEVRFYRAAV
jgi:hypothetical protein